MEDDENFKAKVDASIEEVSRYGKAVDILAAAIADSSFSTQFSLDKTVESLIELGGTHISAKLRFMESMKRQYGIDDKTALLLWRAYSNPTPANREFLKKLGYSPHGVIHLSAGMGTIQGITMQDIMAVLAMLCAADGPFPVGDLIALVGAAVVILLAAIGIIYIAENGEVKTGTPEEEEEAPKGEVTRGRSKAPKTGKPGSTYEQVDEKGNVLSRTTYGENGRPVTRDDYDRAHHIKKPLDRDVLPHRHIYTYNERGQITGHIVVPIPE